MFHLGNVPLSSSEANRAFQALSFYDGRALAPGENLSRLDPMMLLGQAGSMFLFGVSDSVARFVSALAGAGIVLLILALCPFVGRAQAMAMAILATFSPTLLYASRVAEPPVLISFFAMLTLVSLLYHGRDQSGWWAAGVGLGLGSMLGSGPASISVLICMVAGFVAAGLVDSTGEGAARAAIGSLRGRMHNLLILGLTFLGTLIVFFTHGLSSISALKGIPETFSSWGRLVVTSESSIPTQYFLLVILLYEILALVCALIGFAVEGKEGPGRLSSLFFLGWFVAALVLFSFSSGRSASQAILVVLPLLLWGGYGAGALLEAVNWREISGRKAALLVVTIFGLILAIIALIAALGRIGSSSDSTRATVEALMIAVIAVAPLTYLTFLQLPRPEADEERRSSRAWRTPLLALAAAVILLLALYTVRSTVMLNYYRGAGSSELLAERTSTPAVAVFAKRITNVSRDLQVSGASPEDPEGGHSITIEIEQSVRSPFRWYFRDFPNVTIVPNGEAGATGADLVIARDQSGIDQANYTPQTIPYRNRVPPQYVTPSIGNVLKGIFLPSHWEEGVRFLLFRTGITMPEPETAIAGYGPRLSNQLSPSSGPYSLNDRPGPGAGRGQFDDPRGIAADITSGNTYVVDMGNDRVESFTFDGAFAGSWGGLNGAVSFGSTQDGLGPTGIAVGFDGLIYVADTWNHRIVVLNSSGDVVREFGMFGDTADAPDASPNPGSFFGPRAVAVTGDEIFVVDTGNERVQVFAPDGTFLRSWGGNGNGPGQFVEPVGIVVGPDGRVYVADSGNARISVFQRDGTPIAQWPVDAWQGHAYFEPYLAFDDNGLLYATSSATGTVEVFDMNGSYVTTVTGTGFEQFQRPIGITQGADGLMMVTDAGLNAVLEFSPILPPVYEEPEASPEASMPIVPGASPQASPVAEGSPAIAEPTPTAVG
jgi:4-amino-4-deoxy-L-arabinose transferase-like glycosyltransferase/streptogramin lyase